MPESTKNPGPCAGCGKHVTFRGVHEGIYYCTNCLELGNFTDTDPEDLDEEVIADFQQAESYKSNSSQDDDYHRSSQSDEEEEQNDEEERPECPHCGEPQDKKGIGPHKRFCDENPANQEETADDESADEEPTSEEQSEEPAETTTEKTDEPEKAEQVVTTDPDEEDIPEPKEDGVIAAFDGNGAKIEHYTVSLLRVQPPEFDKDLFVAYTTGSSYSAESPDDAVAGLVSQ